MMLPVWSVQCEAVELLNFQGFQWHTDHNASELSYKLAANFHESPFKSKKIDWDPVNGSRETALNRSMKIPISVYQFEMN